MPYITSAITALWPSSRRFSQYTAAIIANLAAVSFGVTLGWPSPTIPLLKAGDAAVAEPITRDDETWLGSLPYLTAFFASPIYGFVNHRFGRKAAGYLTALVAIVAWAIIIFADSITYLYLARVFMGFGLAGVNVFVTTYIGEIAEDDIRGALGTFRASAANVGIIFAYCIGPQLSVQGMGIVNIAVPVLFALAFYRLPESPMYLLGKGRFQEALDSYVWLRGGDNALADEEMKKLSAVGMNKGENITLKSLLSVRGTRKSLLIAVVFCAVMQLSGLSVVFSYSSRFFQMAGSNLSPEMSAITLSLVNFCGTIVASLLADWTGRRPLLIGTMVLQGATLAGFGAYMYVAELGFDLSAVAVLPIIFLSLYCFFMTCGLAALGYVVFSEIFRPEARGVAMSVTNATLWICAFSATKFHHNLEEVINLYGCFWVYACVSFAGALFANFELPETKNRSLECILRDLNGDEEENTSGVI